MSPREALNAKLGRLVASWRETNAMERQITAEEQQITAELSEIDDRLREAADLLNANTAMIAQIADRLAKAKARRAAKRL